MWRGIDTNDVSGANALVKFALRVFAIVPNSAGVERLFSMLGIVHTKHRNRLGVQKSRKIVLVKADINRTYGTGRQEQHRSFDANCAFAGAATATAGGASDVHGSLIANTSVQSDARADALIDSDAASFQAVAAELFELVAEDLADAEASRHAGGDPDHVDLDPAGGSIPPRDTPVPRGAAAYELKWLFEFPSSAHPASVPAAAPDIPPTNSARSVGSETRTRNPLTSFWHCSTNNLVKELVTYEQELANTPISDDSV